MPCERRLARVARVSFREPMTGGSRACRTAAAERLSLGVAARLSRYLQVLTQAKKMGRETISSQELADYTHVNSTQIRRDLSGFGKFGKRGVGYNVDSLVSQIRKILRTTGKHNIALFGAGNLGQAIAGSDIFADHGFRVVAIFDKDPRKVGEGDRREPRRCGPTTSSSGSSATRTWSWACWPCPTEAAQEVADDLVEAGVKIIFNYSEALLQVPPRGDGAHLEPRRRPALRALLLPHLMLDMARVHEAFEASTDFTVGIEEEFAILDPETLSLDPALRRAAATPPRPTRCWPSGRRRADRVGDRDPLRAGARASPTRSSASARRALRLFRAGRRRTARCSAPPAPTPGARGRSSRSSTPSTTGAWRTGLQYVAWRNNTFSLHVHVGRPRRRPRGERSATACARCCRSCWRSRPTRRSSTAATRDCTRRARRSSRRASRAAGSPTRSAAGPAYADYVDFLRDDRLDRRADPDLVEHPAAPLASARSSCASATRRRAPPTRTALEALVTACIAQAALDEDEGVPLEDPPPRLIEENFWRAIRYGLDGKLIDLRARARSSPRRRSAERLLAWTAPARAAARHRRWRCPRRTAPSASAARSRRGRRWRRSSRPRWRETQRTYAAEEVSA